MEVHHSLFGSVQANCRKHAHLYAKAQADHKVDAFWLMAQGRQESGFNPTIGSPAGAKGIAQFMPRTARAWGVNVYDPASSIDGQARFMKGQLAAHKGNWTLALAAYNSGPGRVKKLGRVPYIRETQDYVRFIPQHRQRLIEASK